MYQSRAEETRSSPRLHYVNCFHYVNFYFGYNPNRVAHNTAFTSQRSSLCPVAFAFCLLWTSLLPTEVLPHLSAYPVVLELNCPLNVYSWSEPRSEHLPLCIPSHGHQSSQTYISPRKAFRAKSNGSQDRMRHTLWLFLFLKPSLIRDLVRFLIGICNGHALQ